MRICLFNLYQILLNFNLLDVKTSKIQKYNVQKVSLGGSYLSTYLLKSNDQKTGKYLSAILHNLLGNKLQETKTEMKIRCSRETEKLVELFWNLELNLNKGCAFSKESTNIYNCYLYHTCKKLRDNTIFTWMFYYRANSTINFPNNDQYLVAQLFCCDFVCWY